MNKVFFLLFSFLTLACATAQFGNLGNLRPPLPTASVTRFVPTAVSLRDITFQMDVSVTNPYPAALPLSGVRIQYSVESAKVFEAQTQESFQIPANGQKTNTFIIVLPFDGLIRTIRNYLQKDYLETQADIRITFPLPSMPGLPPNISFDHTSRVRIPAVKPRFQVLNFRVEPPTQADVSAALSKAARNVNPTQAVNMFTNMLAGRPAEPVINPEDLDLPFRVSFTIQIENEARASLSFPQLDFTLTVDGAQLVSGRSTEVAVTGNKTLIRVTNTFSSKNLGQAVQSAFRKGTARFLVTGNASLQLPREILATPLPLSFREEGEFSLR